MNSSMSRAVQHTRSILPLNVTSQFMAPEIFLKLWIAFAMIKTLRLIINIFMVGKWFLIIQQFIFIIHQLLHGIMFNSIDISILYQQKQYSINIKWFKINVSNIILYLNQIKHTKNIYANKFMELKIYIILCYKSLNHIQKKL
eukprot:918262_1